MNQPRMEMIFLGGLIHQEIRGGLSRWVMQEFGWFFIVIYSFATKY